jgi:hypothetical protein
MLRLKIPGVGLLMMIHSIAWAQASGSDVAQRATGCTSGCHGPSLIAQQRLDRAAWVREVDKMISWGARVSPADREAFIDYFSATFNSSRSLPNTSKAVPEGPAGELFQVACMGCHDETPVSRMRLSRDGWAAQIDKMIRWGAAVPSDRREDLIGYLLTAFSR